MNIPQAVGALALGIVIGWTASYFLRRFKRFTLKRLGTLVSVLAGGAAVRLLGGASDALWFYPLGLVGGFAIYMIIAYLAGARRFETKELQVKLDYKAPDGSEIRLLPDVCGGGLSHCTLPPKAISQAVRHKTVEEIWYIIDGRGEVWRKLRKQEEIVEAIGGTSLTFPVGTHFQFRNTGDVPLRFIIATMPPWPGSDEAVRVEDHWRV